MGTVISQDVQASVMLTPYFSSLSLPGGGSFWAPSLMLLSIMTPMMSSLPLDTWLATLSHTMGWLVCSLLELPWEQSMMILEQALPFLSVMTALATLEGPKLGPVSVPPRRMV
jgi:hypothetical protein